MEFFFRNIENFQYLYHVYVLDVVEPTPVKPVEGSYLPDVVEEDADANLDVALPFVLLLHLDMGASSHCSLSEPSYMVFLATEHYFRRCVTDNAVKHLL